MGLKHNGYSFSNCIGRQMGVGVGSTFGNKTVFNVSKLVNFNKKTSVPVGTMPPESFIMARESGGISSRSYGESSISNSNLAGGINNQATINGVASFDNADMRLIIFASASIAGNSSYSYSVTGAVNLDSTINGVGSIPNALPFVVADIAATILSGSIISGADFSSAINIASNISGLSSIDTANASMIGTLSSAIICASYLNPDMSLASNVACAINATSSAGPSDINAIANMAISILSNASVSVSDSPSIGRISGNITPFTELSPQTLSKAVWASLKANSSDPDSMGELMNEIHSEVLKRLKKSEFIALK